MIFICLTCSKQFSAVRAHNRKYCSYSCFGITCRKEKLFVKCATCKKDFKRLESIVKKNNKSYCNRKCADIGMEKNKLELLKSVKDRIKINTTIDGNGCWIWNKYKNKKGYGQLATGAFGRKRAFLAHRASYLVFKGKIPKDKLVCHTCDTPSCVAPIHLFVGTPKDNSQDMVKKNRSSRVSIAIGEKNKNSKITSLIALKIKKLLAEKVTCVEIAKNLRVNKNTVYSIKQNKTWKHID